MPKRLPYKPVPESHVRLAQKIEKKVFKHKINASASDHLIQTKMPKHLYSGKMDSVGKRDRR